MVIPFKVHLACIDVVLPFPKVALYLCFLENIHFEIGEFSFVVN